MTSAQLCEIANVERQLSPVRHQGCGGRLYYVPAHDVTHDYETETIPDDIKCLDCKRSVPLDQRVPPGEVCLTGNEEPEERDADRQNDEREDWENYLDPEFHD